MPVSIVFYPFTAQAVRSQCNSSRPRPGRHPTPSSSIDQFCFCFILHPGAPLWSPELHILSAMIINSPSLSPVSGASIFSEWSHYCTGDSLRLRSPLSPVCCHSPAPRPGPVTNQSGCLLRFVNRLVTSAHYQSPFWAAIKSFFCPRFLGLWFQTGNIVTREDRKPSDRRQIQERRGLNVCDVILKKLLASSKYLDRNIADQKTRLYEVSVQSSGYPPPSLSVPLSILSSQNSLVPA